MAFEAFLTQDTIRPRKSRRITYTVSLAVHGAVLVAGVAYSFWHVDEISPPTVTVTFMSAAPPPPPPPPPPPAGGGAPAKKRVAAKPRPVAEVVQPKPNQIVQPRERERVAAAPKPQEKPEPDEESPDDSFGAGVAGGVKGGTVGGTVGGTIGGTVRGTIGGTGPAGPTAPAGPKLVPPHVAALQKMSGDDPDFPPVLRRAGMVYLITAKICVGTSGAVESVTLLKRAHPMLDDNVVAAVKKWRFRPLMVNNAPVPFCSVRAFQFKSN
jgi:protein TonB